MKMLSAKVICSAAIALSPLLLPVASHAQEAVLAEPDGDRQYQTVAETFDETFFSNDKPFWNNRGIGRQLGSIFGFGFTENEINRDGRAVHQLFVDVYDEQVSTTARIRTPDLVNPYETSVMLTPISEIGAREFEDYGFRQPLPAPPAPAPVAPAPVPALW